MRVHLSFAAYTRWARARTLGSSWRFNGRPDKTRVTRIICASRCKPYTDFLFLNSHVLSWTVIYRWGWTDPDSIAKNKFCLFRAKSSLNVIIIAARKRKNCKENCCNTFLMWTTRLLIFIFVVTVVTDLYRWRLKLKYLDSGEAWILRINVEGKKTERKAKVKKENASCLLRSGNKFSWDYESTWRQIRTLKAYLLRNPRDARCIWAWTSRVMTRTRCKSRSPVLRGEHSSFFSTFPAREIPLLSPRHSVIRIIKGSSRLTQHEPVRNSFKMLLSKQ